MQRGNAMFYRMIENKRDWWFAPAACTVRTLADSMHFIAETNIVKSESDPPRYPRDLCR